MALIFAFQNRGLTRLITVYDSDEELIVRGDSDKIRVRIGYEGELDTNALLTVSSDAATANGSSFMKNSPIDGTHTLRLDASDLNFAAGVYTLAVDYFDSADSSEWKNVDRQVFNLEGA